MISKPCFSFYSLRDSLIFDNSNTTPAQNIVIIPCGLQNGSPLKNKQIKTVIQDPQHYSSSTIWELLPTIFLGFGWLDFVSADWRHMAWEGIFLFINSQIYFYEKGIFEIKTALTHLGSKSTYSLSLECFSHPQPTQHIFLGRPPLTKDVGIHTHH